MANVAAPSILRIELLCAETTPLGRWPSACLIERRSPSSTALQSSLRSCSRQSGLADKPLGLTHTEVC